MARRPGTRSRFSNLMRRYKESGGNPTASEVIEFGNYLKGINKADVNRKPTGNLIKRFRGKVVPFGVTPKASIAESYYSVSITGQGLSIFQGIGTSNDVFGFVPITSDDDAAGVQIDSNFFPAIARLFVAPSSALPTPTTSGITKESYNSVKGRSGSIPFGRGISTRVKDKETGVTETTINEADEADVTFSIANTIKANFTDFSVKSITFVPEAFTPAATPQFAPDTAPALGF